MTAVAEHVATPGYTVVASTDGMSREQWLALRRRGIGGSDAAAIAGMSPYRSPFAVYLEKTELDHGDDTDSEPAYWGRTLEPYVASRFAEITGLGVEPFPFLIASTGRPWQQANLDRLVYPAGDAPTDPRLLECKTVNPWDENYGAGDDIDELPPHAALQTVHYLDVTGFDAAYVAVLIGGQRFRHYRIDRDEQVIEHLRTITAAFWQQVIDRVPPLPTAIDTDLLAHLYDVQPGMVVELDDRAGEVRQLIETRWAAKEAAKAAEAQADEADNRLRALLGEAEIGTLAGRDVVTWKANGTFASKRFAEGEPEMAARFTRPVPALDVERLKDEAPDVYARYRARVLRPKKEL